MIDKIVAVVNDQVITFSDVKKAIDFYPFFRGKDETDEEYFRRVVDDLIRYKVVWLEFHNEFTLTEDDYEMVQTSILQKTGSLEKLEKILARYQMPWADFRAFISGRVLYEKVVRQKFPMNLVIPFTEIEDFYNKEYLPVQRQFELQPLSLVEMTSVIEKHLRKLKTEAELSGWLKQIQSIYRVDVRIGRENQ